MMKKILLPTDFSEIAKYALEYAAFFAKRTRATLHIVTVLKTKNTDKIKQAEEKLEALKQDHLLKDIDIVTHIEIGESIRSSIVNTAEKINVDLIIMGSNGASLFGEIMLGSNTEKVIRKTRYSVLTIKHQMISLKLSSIAFASDFSEPKNKAFIVVRELANLFNCTIHLLKINTPNHFEPTRLSLEKMDKFIKAQELDELGIKYNVELYADSNEELGILNFCIENNMDMIAIGTHGKKAIWKLLNDSTSQSLVNHSFRPVLTIKL
jgi:nucleotide-binding universal stress UspA family protein